MEGNRVTAADQWKKLARVADDLLTAYRDARLTVTAAVSDAALRRLRDFADAFAHQAGLVDCAFASDNQVRRAQTLAQPRIAREEPGA